MHGRGFKIADDTRGELFDPTDGDRTPTKEGIARARALLAERFPELAKAPLLESQVCQYENSPDGDLIIDRHPELANVWLAGGGVKAGTILGATDDYGYRAVDEVCDIHDLHATILYLLGLDHELLTFRFEGRDHRLTDVHGRVLRGTIA